MIADSAQSETRPRQRAITAEHADDVTQWHEPMDRHDYFGLREALASGDKAPGPARAFYEAVVDDKFNRPEDAEKKFRTVLKSNVPDRYKVNTHDHLGELYLRQGQYQKAASEFGEITKNFAYAVSKKERKDYATTEAIFRGLAGVPPTMRASDSSDVLRVVTDEKHIITNDLAVNGVPVRFGFDSGANFSICSESQARAMRLREPKKKAQMGTINEKQLGAEFQIAESLSIGSVKVRTVVFLVVPDAAMQISGMDGVVGFPVMAAFRKTAIVFNDAHVLSTKKPSELAFDGLNLLASATLGGKRARFQLDTGASRTDLYPHFRSLLRLGSWNLGKVETRVSTGIGGSTKIKIRRLRASQFEFAGTMVQLTDAPLWLETKTEASRNFDGNVGYDVFKQLGTMTIDLKTMTLSSGEPLQ